MIKIFPIESRGMLLPHAGDQFFDYEFGKDNWYYSSIDKADFLATMSGVEVYSQVKRENWSKYGKPILHLHIQHYGDGQEKTFKEWFPELASNAYVVCDLDIKDPPPFYIHTPFTQNVCRSYAQDFQFTFPSGKFYYIGKSAFDKINRNFDPSNKSRIFISVNKTHDANNRNCYIRHAITKLVYEKYSHLGHIGNKDGLGIWLADNTFNATTLDELYAYTADKDRIIAFGQNYPHLLYWQDTFISFCGETYEGEYGNGAYGVTEKSWIPMFQGHFILPFGAQGIISYMQRLGFKFPKEINYEYDSIDNYLKRTEVYLQEVNRLCNLSLDTWKQIYSDNVDILKHNQSMIIDVPPHRCNLLEKIGLGGLNNVIQ